MRISLTNIGIWKHASLDINGITLVAGKNGTGKSTFGKALFAIFNTLNNLNERVHNARQKILKRQIQGILNFEFPESRIAYRRFIAEADKKDITIDNYEEIIGNLRYIPDDIKSILKEKIQSILNLPEEQIKNDLMLRALQGEFENQISNLNSEHQSLNAKIELTIRKLITEIEIKNNGTEINIKNTHNLDIQPIYIDDFPYLPVISNGFGANLLLDFFPRHVLEMSKLIKGYNIDKTSDAVENTISRLLQNEKLRHIKEKLDNVCHGYLKTTSSGLKFVDEIDNNQYSTNNIASGLKTFLLLEDLILNGTIEQKGTVILDEPETHLHPEWQIALAELIVLLQKAFSLHILIASHSPYFISAIDAYSHKYNTIDTTKYYFTQTKNHESSIEDVTNKLSLIFNSLAGPYQYIENIYKETDNENSNRI